MNDDDVNDLVQWHGIYEYNKQTKFYPYANPYEGRAIQWVYIFDFGNGQQITFSEKSKIIWQRENK